MWQSLCMGDGRDDQGTGIVNTIIVTGAEEWIQFTFEGITSEGADGRPFVYIVEGDLPLLIIHINPHLLRLLGKRKCDRR